ncbi:hypothetical protein [Flavobacterium sp.]|uniref:hypothetical protein n=1 Tax=Flavobacterium sp. TaxID=239 RepID=UPI00263704A0|nr:hypothetical protein [Flavobacterium sp.]
MPILILLQLLIAFILLLLLIAGPILMFAGFFWENKKQIRLGFKMFIIPFTIIASVAIHHVFWNLVIKPNENDLLGYYELTSSSAAKNGKTTLRLYENGVFEKTSNINRVLCEKGRYHSYDNEIWFTCNHHSSVAKISKGLMDYKLKFITNNNPNSDDNLVFEKVSD